MKRGMYFVLTVCLLLCGTAASAAEPYFAKVSVVKDSTTGYDITCVNLNGHNTARAYFTQGMWTSDSKRLILADNQDGYLYEYNVETQEVRRLVHRGADYYVTPLDGLFYVQGTTIYRMDLTTYETEVVTVCPDGTSGVSSIHVNNDETRLTVSWRESASDLDYSYDESGNRVSRLRRIPVFNLETNQWDTRYSHEFDAPYPQVTHILMNPVYKDLVFFCHEGTTTEIPDRLWTLNTTTGEQKNVFEQYNNSTGKTGEPSGHENWTADGENLVFVKYNRGTNLGQSGIVRIGKDGDETEYINGDYDYWHCHPSSDNRWIVADTQESLSQDDALGFRTGPTSIVLVDSKTSTSHPIARVKIGQDHPWQPHPAFSPDGKKVAFAMISDENILSVGIVDVSDIVGEKKVEGHGVVNEDSGVIVSNVSETEDRFGVTVESLNGEKEFIFAVAAYENGRLESIALDKKTVQESVNLSVTLNSQSKNIRKFLWDSALTPYSLEPTSPQKLRMLHCGPDSIRLQWFHPKNVSGEVEYVVSRDGQEIARVQEPCYYDCGLEMDTVYTYSVYAVYPTGLRSPAVQWSFQTAGEAYSMLSSPIQQKNMHFLDTNNTGADAYTEAVTYGGRQCRKSTSQQQIDGGVKTGKFYFWMDPGYITPMDRNLTVTIEYYDEGTSDLKIEYNSPNGIAESKYITTRQDTKTWKTASVTLDNARFTREKALSNSDFRIEGGPETYLASVRVEKADAEERVVYQTGKASLGEEDTYEGLTLYSVEGDSATEAAELGGVPCRVAEKDHFFYFDVDDTFLYGPTYHNVTIKLRYYDSGTDTIWLQYNTSDSTAQEQAYKRRSVVQKTNTNTWKTVEVPLIDASFRNAQDTPYFADFRLGASDGLALNFVEVIPCVKK